MKNKHLFEIYNQLFTKSPYGILIFENQTQKLTLANQAAADLYGYDAEELSHLTVKDILPDDKIHKQLSHFTQLPDANNQYVYHRRKDGSLFPVEKFKIALGQNNRLFECYIVKDLSFHKQKEENIKINQQRLEKIFHSVQAAVIVIDIHNDLIMDANQNAIEVLDLPLNRFLGRPYCDFFMCLDQKNERNAISFEQDIKSMECLVLTKAGHFFPVLLNSQTISYIDRKHAIVSFSDLTSLKKAEGEKRKIEAQLFQSQKMEALGTLVAGMAHEINNPINLIMLNIPLLHKVWSEFLPFLNNFGKTEPGKKFGGLPIQFILDNFDQLYEDMDMAARRIAKIVSDLKNFARQSYTEDKAPIQIEEALQNALRLVNTTVKKAGIDLKIHYHKNLPLIEGNLHNIEQILINLILNAVQAIKHDKGRIELVTGYHDKDQQVFISISDNGEGIDPAIEQRIFNPFETTKQSQGGTGLGLSVTYSLVKSHNGTIQFTNNGNQGTTFLVYFPVKKVIKKYKVLIVDDEESLRELLAKSLRRNPIFDVREAINGTEALVKIGTFQPDILILDFRMPEMNGVEVCRIIRSEPNLSQMNVVVFTGFIDDPELKVIEKMGFKHIYPKSIGIKEFINHIENFTKNEINT